MITLDTKQFIDEELWTAWWNITENIMNEKYIREQLFAQMMGWS